MTPLKSRLIEYFKEGSGFDSIVRARRWAESVTGEIYAPGTPSAKQLEETIEESLVEVAKQLVREAADPLTAFDRLVDLYQRQPPLSTRASGSVARQAYSTPLPIAYLASKMAGIDETSRVYEPTAGNGNLLIEANPALVTANEIDPERVRVLKEQGYQTTAEDAATYQPPERYDVVIANPPFGRIVDLETERNLTWDAGKYRTTQIDHAIALNCLKAMKDGGRAVLIVAGIKDLDLNRRSDRYNSGQTVAFFKNLYDNYKVTEHVSLDGKMYGRQGAGFPIDLIKIEGRGQSPKPYPAVELPPIYRDFKSLRDEVLTHVLDASQKREESRNANDTLLDGGRTSAEPEGDRERHRISGVVSQSGAAFDSPRTARGGTGDNREFGAPGAAGGGGADLSGQGDSRTGRRSAFSANRAELGSSADGRQSSFARTAFPVPESQLPTASSHREPGTRSQRTDRESELVGMVGTGIRHADRQSLLEPEKEELSMVETATATSSPSEQQEKQLQSPYQPFSGGRSFGGLTPYNMRSTIRNALQKLVDRVTREEGIEEIDDWVVMKMNERSPDAKLDSGTWDKKRLHEALSAEQIDSVALGIDNFDRNSEFIIGDDTGFGKSRQLAMLTVYGMQQGLIPTFITKDANLYRDVLNGFDEIGVEGINPFFTDSKLDLELMNGEEISYNQREHAAEMEEAIASGDLGDRNLILSTYSQLQTVSGREPRRRELLRRFNPGGFLIMDEAHLAGGNKSSQPFQRAHPNAAEFARELKRGATRTLSASATFAKYPEVMDLYFRTDMRKAVENDTSLVSIISEGGEPLQELLSNQLAEAGQYIRRERPFEAEFGTAVFPIDRELTDTEARVMSAINAFDRVKDVVCSDMEKHLKAEAKKIGEDNSVGKPGVDSTNFSSLMHNYLSVSNLAKKMNGVIDLATQTLQNNEKPFIGVANTVAAFLEQYAEDNNIQPGEEIDVDLGDMLMRYAWRSREVQIKNAYGEIERRLLTDEELGAEGVAAWEEILEAIEAADFSSAPISPIDWYKTQMQERGYTVGEITGRTSGIDYQRQADGSYKAIYVRRGSEETSLRAKGQTIDGFNGGSIDTVIGNQSASTGISAHASEKFADQRRRHFIVAQPEKDINTAKQFFGRFDRTGQVNAPRITIGAGDLPHERREQAILMQKLASLSANTTASRDSQIDFGGAVDFMNEYGDEIAIEIVKSDPALEEALDFPIKYDDSGSLQPGSIRRVTGRMPLLPLSEQEALIQKIETDYKDLIAQLDALGENKLKSSSLDLDAVTLASVDLISADPDSDSPFTDAVKLDVLDIRNDRRPYTTLEVINGAREQLGLKPIESVADCDFEQVGQLAKEAASEQQQEIEKALAEYQTERVQLFKTEKSREKFLETTRQQADTIQEMLAEYPVGETVKLRTPKNQIYYGVVLGHSSRDAGDGNPLRPSNYKVSIALADSAKKLDVAYSKIGDSQSKYRIEPADVDPFDGTPIYELFDKRQGGDREKALMLTGNLIRAAEKYGTKGRVVNYTDRSGNLHQGLMMNKSFNIEQDLQQAPVKLPDAGAVRQFTREYGRAVENRDGRLKLYYDRAASEFVIEVPKSKAKGGEFFLDRNLLNAATPAGEPPKEFYTIATRAELRFPPSQLQPVTEWLERKKGGAYAKGEEAALAREMLDIELPDFGKLMKEAEAKSVQIQESGIAASKANEIERRRDESSSKIESDRVQQQRAAKVAPIVKELLEYVGSDCYSGSENLAYWQDGALHTDTKAGEKRLRVKPDGKGGWQDVGSSLSEEDVSHYLEVKSILNARKEQQAFVERLAPVVGDYHDLKGKYRFDAYESNWDAAKQLLTLADKITGKNVLVAEATPEGWKDRGSGLTPEIADKLEQMLQPKIELFQDRLQQKRLMQVAAVVVDDLQQHGSTHRVGQHHISQWDANNQILTLQEKDSDKKVIHAQWDQQKGWVNREGYIPFHKARHFTERVRGSLEQNKQNQRQDFQH